MTALLKDVKTTRASAASMIPLSSVRPDPAQPRKFFSEDALSTLVKSVQERGILQPLLLRPAGNTYLIVAGERRYRAAKAAGLKEVPAVVQDLSDKDARELAITENLNREDLNPVEETDAIIDLLSLRLNKDRDSVLEVLKRHAYELRTKGDNTGVANSLAEPIDSTFASLGRFTAQSFVQHRLPLLSLPTDLLDALRAGTLHYSKAKLLARVKNEADRRDLTELATRTPRRELKRLIAAHMGEAVEINRDLKRLKRFKTKLTPKRFSALSRDDAKRADKLIQELEQIFDRVVFN